MNKILLLSTFFLIACGVSDSSDEADGISSSDHRIFVTSNSFNGSLGGISGADDKCLLAARAAGLERTYRAILSTASSNAEERLNITGNVFVFTDSETPQLVAPSGVALWGTRLSSLNGAINRDEFFNLSAVSVWTGTGIEGDFIAGNTCSDWSFNSGSGFTGRSDSISQDWVENIPANCSASNRLYCISTN